MISTRLISLGLGYIAGIVCATLLPTHRAVPAALFWVLLVLGAAAAAWTLLRELNWKENHIAARTAPLILASFCAANIITNNFIHSENPGVIFFRTLPDRCPVEMRGIISAETETRSDTRLDVRLRAGEIRKASDEAWTKLETPVDIKVSVMYPADDPARQEVCAKLADTGSYGYLVEMRGINERSKRPGNPGGFDYEAFLMSEGFAAAVKVFDKSYGKEDFIRVIEERKGNPLVEAALVAKKDFISTIQRTIPPPESFFVSGATLGTRFSIKKQEYRGKFIEDFFRHSGVGHVLAVSGLHVSVVSLLLYSLFRMTRVPPKYFTPFLILLLFSFAFLTGARPSSLRATIMNSLVIVMYVYGGGGISRSAYTGLAFSSFIILLRRPMALYSAGFLLSFGAVLSLVMLTTPFDKLLRSLRGGRLLAAVLWFALCIYTICTAWDIFLRWESLGFFALLFVLMLKAGDILNGFLPRLAALNMDRLPAALRVFLSAQLGIQFGMMIPLSSFFFGQMPVAGMFVNLLAIPLIGVIVQLGLLGGILGAIPFIGEPLALVVGAANYLVAKFFIWAAYLGSELLPFPVTPIPTVRWLAAYYVLVAIFASSPLWFRRLQSAVYVIHRRHPVLVSRFAPPAAAAVLLAGMVFRHNIPQSGGAELQILAGSSTPVACIVRTDYRRGATLINGGHSFFAKSSLKSFLLKKNNIVIEDLFVGGHSPEFGTGAAAELAKDIKLEKVHYPNFHEPADGKRPPLFDSMEAYFNAIGETKTLKSALEGKSWAVRYYDLFRSFNALWRDEWILFTPPAEFTLDNGTRIEYLAPVYRSYPIAIRMVFENATVLLLPDTGSTKKIPRDKLKADILVIAGPSRINYRSYVKSLEYVIKDCSPKTIVLCVDNSFNDRKMTEAVERASDLCSTRAGRFIRTDESGALGMAMDGNRLSEKIRMHLAR